MTPGPEPDTSVMVRMISFRKKGEAQGARAGWPEGPSLRLQRGLHSIKSMPIGPLGGGLLLLREE